MPRGDFSARRGHLRKVHHHLGDGLVVLEHAQSVLEVVDPGRTGEVDPHDVIYVFSTSAIKKKGLELVFIEHVVLYVT